VTCLFALYNDNKLVYFRSTTFQKVSIMKTAHFVPVFLIVILLASCSGGNPSPTPTPVDVNALQTAAVQTVVADITRTAIAQPTATLLPTETLAPLPTEIPTLTVTPTSQACDDSAFINDASVPDGMVMAAGQEFVKTWKVKNSGTCSWTTGYQLVYSYGERMGGLPINLTVEVAPNTDVEISVQLKAPLKSGTYSGYWRLANNNGYAFGDIFTVIITVP
jgi:hypothetical protein